MVTHGKNDKHVIWRIPAVLALDLRPFISIRVPDLLAQHSCQPLSLDCRLQCSATPFSDFLLNPNLGRSRLAVASNSIAALKSRYTPSDVTRCLTTIRGHEASLALRAFTNQALLPPDSPLILLSERKDKDQNLTLSNCWF